MPGFVTKADAPSEQAAGANPKGAQGVKISEYPVTIALMRVKKDLAIVNMGGDLAGQATEFSGGKSEKGK